MSYEEIRCKLEDLEKELEKAKENEEIAYNKMILNELIDIRLLLSEYVKGTESEGDEEE